MQPRFLRRVGIRLNSVADDAEIRLGGGRDGLHFFAMAIVVTLVVVAVMAVAALILAFLLVVGLLRCVGWTMARLCIGDDKGPRLQARMARVFHSSTQKGKRVNRRGAKPAVSAPKDSVVCPSCASAVTLPASGDRKCPSCRHWISVPPMTPASAHDPWLNEIAVALGDDLGLIESTRNTGKELGGAPLQADIAFHVDKFAVCVNLFAKKTFAHHAEIGLRAAPQMRDAISYGSTILRKEGRPLYIAHNRGRIVDELRLDDVIRVVGTIVLPGPGGRKRQPSTH